MQLHTPLTKGYNNKSTILNSTKANTKSPISKLPPLTIPLKNIKEVKKRLTT